MSDVAVKVDNLTKIYKLYNKHSDRLKEALHPLRKNYHTDFHALNNVSFEIKKGDTLGIIGKNGSGKSTLLKILTGVLTKTAGDVLINGKISALLELGAGFNIELNGLDNVYFSGTIMGYTKQEMDAKIDDIIAFADIGDFIYQPVKTYSSGMFVRLAFAVATAVDPDILIVDEALSVGDVRFQQKCMRRMQDIRDRGKTIVFVSHDPGVILNFCKYSLWLDNGELKQFDTSDKVMKSYTYFMAYGFLPEIKSNLNDKNVLDKKSLEIDFESVEECDSFGDRLAAIEGVAFLYDDMSVIKIISTPGWVNLYLKIHSFDEIFSPIVGFILKDSLGNSILGMNTLVYDYKIDKFEQDNSYFVKVRFYFPFIKNGKYTISPAVASGTQHNHIQHIWVHDAVIIDVINIDNISVLGMMTFVERENMNIEIISLD